MCTCVYICLYSQYWANFAVMSPCSKLLMIYYSSNFTWFTWECHLFSRGWLAMTLHRRRSEAILVQPIFDSPVHFEIVLIQVVRGLPLGLLPSSFPSSACVKKLFCRLRCPKYLSCLCFTDLSRLLSVFILSRTSTFVTFVQTFEQ